MYFNANRGSFCPTLRMGDCFKLNMYASHFVFWIYMKTYTHETYFLFKVNKYGKIFYQSIAPFQSSPYLWFIHTFYVCVKCLDNKTNADVPSQRTFIFFFKSAFTWSLEIFFRVGRLSPTIMHFEIFFQSAELNFNNIVKTC